MQGYKLGRAALDRIFRATRRSENKTTTSDFSGDPKIVRSSGTSIAWQRGRNGANATIPAYSPVAIGAPSGSYSGDGICCSLTKPAGATSGVVYGLTGQSACPATGPSGQASLCSFHLEPGWAAFDPFVGSAPTPGDIWGPTSGQWYLIQGKPGFEIVQCISLTGRLVLVRPSSKSPKALWIGGTLTAALTAGGSVTVSITWHDNGAAPTFTGTPTVFSRESLFTGVSGKKFQARYSPEDDAYYLVWVEGSC